MGGERAHLQGAGRSPSPGERDPRPRRSREEARMGGGVDRRGTTVISGADGRTPGVRGRGADRDDRVGEETAKDLSQPCGKKKQRHP